MIRLFRVFIPASVVALLISEVLLVLACYVVALYFLQIDPAFYLFDENNYWKLALLAAFIILGMYFQDLYASLRIRSRILLVQQVCLAVGCALLAVAFIGYIQPNVLMGRGLMMLGSVLVIIMLPSWRVFFWFRRIIERLRQLQRFAQRPTERAFVFDGFTGGTA